MIKYGYQLGPCKGWNFFFAKNELKASSNKTHPFLFIDMQWTGRGHPLQDVAYALTTTLDEDTLEKMDSLVDCYIDKLGKIKHLNMACKLYDNGLPR